MRVEESNEPIFTEFFTFNNSFAMACLKIANFSNNLHDTYYLMIKSYINISDLFTKIQ